MELCILLKCAFPLAPGSGETDSSDRSLANALPVASMETLSKRAVAELLACPHVAGVAALWWQCLSQNGIKPTAKNMAARLMAHARKNVFVAQTDESDAGKGLVTAP